MIDAKLAEQIFTEQYDDSTDEESEDSTVKTDEKKDEEKKSATIKLLNQWQRFKVDGGVKSLSNRSKSSSSTSNEYCQELTEKDILCTFIAQSIGIMTLNSPTVTCEYKKLKKKHIHKENEHNQQKNAELIRMFVNACKVITQKYLANKISWNNIEEYTLEDIRQFAEENHSEEDIPSIAIHIFKNMRKYQDNIVLRKLHSIYNEESNAMHFKIFIDNSNALLEAYTKLCGRIKVTPTLTKINKSKDIIKIQHSLLKSMHHNEKNKDKRNRIASTIRLLIARNLIHQIPLKRISMNTFHFNKDELKSDTDLLVAWRLIKRITTRIQANESEDPREKIFKRLSDGGADINKSVFYLPNYFKKSEHIIFTMNIVAKFFYYYDSYKIVGCRPHTYEFGTYGSIAMESLNVVASNSSKVEEKEKSDNKKNSKKNARKRRTLPSFLPGEPLSQYIKKHFPLLFTLYIVEGMRLPSMLIINRMLLDILEDKEAKKKLVTYELPIIHYLNNKKKCSNYALWIEYMRLLDKLSHLNNQLKLDKDKYKDIQDQLTKSKSHTKNKKQKLNKKNQHGETAEEIKHRINETNEKILDINEIINKHTKSCNKISLVDIMPVAAGGIEKACRSLTKFLARYMHYHYALYGNKIDKPKTKNFPDEKESNSAYLVIIKLSSYIMQVWFKLKKITLNNKNITSISNSIMHHGVYHWFEELQKDKAFHKSKGFTCS